MHIFMYICCIIFAVSPIILGVTTDKDHRSEISHNDGKLWRRFKREMECGPGSFRFQCTDGTCLSWDKKCDGIVDCPDGTDEKHHICRNMRCPDYHFRCTYGACVDGTASCNGISECADNSDELQPPCRNNNNILGDKFKCNNGELIEVYQRCDGIAECSDGTDETLATCASVICPSHLFQCAYGACVDSGADCNNMQECADGSDESDLLCNRTSVTTTTSTTTEAYPSICVLPNHPKHGRYSMTDGVKNIKYIPRIVQYSLVVLYTMCYPGFKLVGEDVLVCREGIWSSDFPKCVRECKLERSESVEYRCITEKRGYDGTRECEEYEQEDTIIQPECRKPNYHSPKDLKTMHCIDGEWNYKPSCEPECGTVTPEGVQLVRGGISAKRGELPWHAGIYSKLYSPYMQICGGSLISTTIVISAAHCFWSDANQPLPAVNFAVGVGKLYRPYNEKHDAYAQKSDVSNITIPTHFRGSSVNFQDDIAIVVVVTPFTFEVYIRPVCLNFDVDFDRTQLTEGNMGKVAGWGLTDKNGKPSPVLKVVNLPYVKFEDCYKISPPTFRAYITSDKICAGYTNGTTLCQGDSGGGLTFPAYKLNAERHYLRGIVSTAPRNDDLCTIHSLITFTSILKHEHFIKQFL